MERKAAVACVQARLFELQDMKYREFHSGLIPTVDKDTIIGVRMPAIRKLAKSLKDGDTAKLFLEVLPHTYYEENNLHGCLIMAMKDYGECMAALERFLPFVDNWATCDLLSPAIFKKHLPELLPHIRRWLASEKVYTVRFGIGVLMGYYLDEAFSPEYPRMVAALRSEEYYVNMMIAWYFATALAKQWEAVIPYLEENKMDMWVHNKTIQKACESYRITDAQKEYLRSLRIKNRK